MKEAEVSNSMSFKVKECNGRLVAYGTIALPDGQFKGWFSIIEKKDINFLGQHSQMESRAYLEGLRGRPYGETDVYEYSGIAEATARSQGAEITEKCLPAG